MRSPLAMHLILEEARKPGPALPPRAVISALAAVADPMTVISAIDGSDTFQSACNADLGFLALVRNANPVDAAAVARAAGLIRWIATEVKTWADATDPQRRQLAAMLLTSACCDFDGSFWANLPGGPPSQELLTILSRVLSGARFSIDSYGDYDKTPLWEREAVERIKQADAAQDWQALDQLWLVFRSAIRPNLVLTQAMRCLAGFDPVMLVGALASVSHMAMAMQLTAALSQTAKLQLGAASDNVFIQFSVLSHLAPRGGATSISAEDQKLLVQLLQKVTLDVERWKTWVVVFGTRHEIQEALGHVLADTSDAAVRAYVNALPLSTIPTNTRTDVATCLRAFRSVARPDRVRLLWTLAFERWRAWGFPNEIKDLSLTRVTESVLDYAIVGYLVECISQSERERAHDALMVELDQSGRPWYADMSQYLDVVHRIMSRLQPYLHADHALKTGDDWLQLKMQWPFDATKELYRALTLSANFH